MRILLLCDYRPAGPSTVLDHIHAIELFSGHDVHRLSMMGDLPDGLNLNSFDAIIIHYSLVLSNDSYVSPLARHRLRRFGGLKAVFIQDEYRWVNKAIDALIFIKAKVLFTCVPEAEIPKVYNPSRLPDLKTINVLTGYVPAKLLGRATPSYSSRRVEVGYRGRRISAAFGALGCEKWQISERFLEYAGKYQIMHDISCSEDERIYGEDWIKFIENSKAMLGVESGASVFDWEGELFPAVTAAEISHPSRTFESLAEEYFPGEDGLIKMNQISPRCFESASLRTLMILYEGDYSGVLQPWRHYIPLKKDFSNLESVINAVRDAETWHEITDAAYNEIACNAEYSFEGFGSLVGRSLAESANTLDWRPQQPAVSESFSVVAEQSQVAAQVQITRADSLAALHRALDKFILSPLPLWIATPLRKLMRLFYRGALKSFRHLKMGKGALETIGRLRHIAGDTRVPIAVYIEALRHCSRLVSELESLTRFQLFGRSAYLASGLSEFAIEYDVARQTLLIRPSEERDFSAVKGHGLHDPSVIDYAKVRDIKLECREAALVELKTQGLLDRDFPILACLMRKEPDYVVSLIKGEGDSTPWAIWK